MNNSIDLTKLEEGLVYIISPIDSEEKGIEAFLTKINYDVDGFTIISCDFEDINEGDLYTCSLSELDSIVETNPVKEMLRGSYYYESTRVGSTKKYKSCDLCGASIPVGSAHTGAKLFHGEFYQVNFCNTCDTDYVSELSIMSSGGYDDY